MPTVYHITREDVDLNDRDRDIHRWLYLVAPNDALGPAGEFASFPLSTRFMRPPLFYSLGDASSRIYIKKKLSRCQICLCRNSPHFYSETPAPRCTFSRRVT